MSLLPNDYDLEKEWRKVSGPFDHPDFVTHSNYLHYMSKNSNKLSLSCSLCLNKKMRVNKKAQQKVKLLNLTLENLMEENKNIGKYPEYSIVCVSWMPVKSYYLMFNLIILLEYLICSNEYYLATSHIAVLGKFKDMIFKGSLFFNEAIFNKICEVEKIENWKIPMWENVKRANVDSELRYKQIIKKLLQYSKEEYKRRNKIKSLRGKSKKDYRERTTINLCEFFYWYRIKANYRDMEFIDKGVKVNEFKEFYSDYYQLSLNFYSAFKDCINRIAVIRTGKPLLN